MDGSGPGRQDIGSPSPACEGCGERLTRRRALAQISAAAVAAMAGVTLRPGTALALPVTQVTGTPIAPDEHAYPIPASDVVTIDHDQQVIVVRFQQKGYVFNLACPHENTALRWKARDGYFKCPRHESEYQPDGTFIRGRATRNMDRFALRRDGDSLIADFNRLYRSDQQPQEWAAAFVSL